MNKCRHVSIENVAIDYFETFSKYVYYDTFLASLDISKRALVRREIVCGHVRRYGPRKFPPKQSDII